MFFFKKLCTGMELNCSIPLFKIHLKYDFSYMITFDLTSSVWAVLRQVLDIDLCFLIHYCRPVFQATKYPLPCPAGPSSISYTFPVCFSQLSSQLFPDVNVLPVVFGHRYPKLVDKDTLPSLWDWLGRQHNAQCESSAFLHTM